MLAKKVIFSRRKENCIHKHVCVRVPMCVSEVRGKEAEEGTGGKPRGWERRRGERDWWISLPGDLMTLVFLKAETHVAGEQRFRTHGSWVTVPVRRGSSIFFVERVEVGNLCMGSTVGFRYLLALNICVPYNLEVPGCEILIYVEMKRCPEFCRTFAKYEGLSVSR